MAGMVLSRTLVRSVPHQIPQIADGRVRPEHIGYNAAIKMCIRDRYDTSHCINAGGDYLQETRDWGKRFIHVHLKGAVKIEGKVYDNPPAGMDQTDWTSFMGILYGLGYDGGLSIEPESAYWLSLIHI